MSGKRRVLVIDDDRAILEVSRRALERAGYEAEVAETAAQGLAAARARPFDLILLDIELPDLSGLEALRRLVAEVQARVVMISGHVDSELAKDALLLGAKGLLAKPFDLTALCDAIPGYLAR